MGSHCLGSVGRGPGAFEDSHACKAVTLVLPRHPGAEVGARVSWPQMYVSLQGAILTTMLATRNFSGENSLRQEEKAHD